MNVNPGSVLSINQYQIDLLRTQNNSCVKTLQQYISVDGNLDAETLQKDWFPDVNADVFISHSHDDEQEVFKFAGYLMSLGLHPFVDSMVWRYADDLLQKINDKYHRIRKNSDNSTTYSYGGCNYSAAQVYLLLNSALIKMMDKTESIIFLDTPNSIQISSNDNYKTVTNSAWLFSELMATNLLKENVPIRKKEKRDFIFHEDGGMNFPVNLSNLANLSMSNILEAVDQRQKGTGILDYLYEKCKWTQ